jgi:hypothetical protein
MKRQPAMKERSCWPGACFSRAWGSGRVRQLRRRYLGAHGLHFRPRPKPAVGFIAGAVVVGMDQWSLASRRHLGERRCRRLGQSARRRRCLG